MTENATKISTRKKDKIPKVPNPDGIWTKEVRAEINHKAVTGQHRVRGMGVNMRYPNFDDLLVLPAQLSRLSVDTYREPCVTKAVLGTRFAKKPLEIETPIMISGMSYGALGKEAKTALAKATQIVGTSINNGEGGLLPEERDNSYKQVVQILPSRFGFSLETIEAADALEIICGIGAKPGLTGHLLGSKISEEIAEMRQIPPGLDLYSHPRHGDIFGPDDMVLKIQELRDITNYEIPIFLKIAAGRVTEDVKIAVKTGADGVVIDGCQGGTGAAPVVALKHLGVPTLPALVQATKALEDMGVKDEFSLIVSGGIKDGADVAKAMALGADAVAIGTGANIALGCTTCHQCHEGICGSGICTQEPKYRELLKCDAAERVANYITAMTNEAVILAKAAGKTRLSNLEREDIRSITLEACAMTGIPLVGTNYTFTERFGFC
ncbi:MAG: FMN-binding glutamate synthase family protein [SAR324 cluster bacterium]|jgi:glutamate synthase domain-containing protein 2|nr:FMN-binding glutamate synthase family protein [SAR324 cluster bacterium]MDP7045920.1 FMN-binding glutamate synthase family protein [SAR324 cluster bacterium]MDP7582930.1 FMN-binding glutamate synthase family protein [SAR324 cluster bacterium]|tara:strand:- start:3116 stop:4429 length:1314 start_codon:yes stop_codon:yes gene_type:complete